ncbi:3-ketoacyl-CoA thiolase, peroxisomal [Diutina catenulata]
MNRLNQLSGQLYPSGVDAVKQKNPDDVVIVGAYRTALTKGMKGSFKDVGSDYILAKFLQALVKKTNLDVNLVEDMAVGNVLNRSAGATEHRGAMLAAGFPDKTAFIAVNRFCSSGLMAIQDIANKIKAGEIECGVACGVESMSQNYGARALPTVDEHLMDDPKMQECLIPMGITNENVAEKHSIPRSVQDAFAAESYNKAEAAVASGKFKSEILPIEAFINEGDEDDEKWVTKTVDTDEGPRKGVTAQSLGKIRPAFKEDGTTTAGNSSQVSDGAAGVVLMKRSLAEAKGYKIEAKFVTCITVGCAPATMGEGPGIAIPAMLNKLNIKATDVDVYEVNEAFAAQALWSVEQIGVPKGRLNINGGAIALGHPLGATGARQYATILPLLKPGQIGVTGMCIGSGQGSGSLIVRE